MRVHVSLATVAVLSMGVLSACGGGGGLAGPGPGTEDAAVVGDGGGDTFDVPCEVADVLTMYCVSCHGATPVGGAQVSITSRADLLALAPGKATTVAEEAVTRMNANVSPMPPTGALRPDAAEIAAFAAWVTGGTPVGSCGGVITDPYDTPLVCTSKTLATAHEGWAMRPGEKCVSCHVAEHEGPRFEVAGTVYPTAHEPDKCNGARGAGVVVEITDANGHVFKPTVHNSGNFGVNDSSFTPPYSARVLFEGRVRQMVTMPSDPDCNSCHTQDGSGSPMAPGRIMLP